MSTNIVFTTSLGREFHSLIFRGKKETLETSFFALRTTNLKGWFPRVFLSLVYFIWAATKKYVSLWKSLCIKDSPAVFILAAKVSAAFLSHLKSTKKNQIVLLFASRKMSRLETPAHNLQSPIYQLMVICL